jgi:hypothetical protein
LRALLWVVGEGVSPVTGRPDQPVTVEVAEVEWWSAWAALDAKTVHLAPLGEISHELGVVYRCPTDVEMAVAYATWVVLSWLLGMQDPQGPNGLKAWLFQGSTPSAEQLFQQATADEAGVRRPSEYWAALWRRMERDARRHRRIATWLRQLERQAARMERGVPRLSG